MAPLWGSSWSSTVHSIYRYNPVQTTDTNGASAPPSPTSPDASLRPSIGQILVSKRMRYMATALVVLVLFGLVFHNYDPLPSIGSLRKKTGVPVELPAASTKPSQLFPSFQELSSVDTSHVNWSRYAYTQYVTNSEYLCNSVMIFETLFQLKSKADRVMLYPVQMMADPASTDGTTNDQRLLIKARDNYKAKLIPISVQHRYGADSTWAESFTKLLAFNQTQYARVLNVDSDSTILQHMDELFLAPASTIAMPHAYWLWPGENKFSSQLMLVQPSAAEFDRVMQKMQEAGPEDYDMEIVNQLYADKAMVLPHRPYDLVTTEFRYDSEHWKYLGSDSEVWDPAMVYSEAKFVHFSDWPVPKPWRAIAEDVRLKHQPKCVNRGGEQGCLDRKIWNGLYTDMQYSTGVAEMS
ncbi:glucose N-acetyltransferase [Apiospora saccharicola]